MKTFLKKNIYPISLFLITLMVALANFEPGTILSGWDTLHPEFNFYEYFRRVIFGVWQEHQGIGALASQAHASELSRLFIYYPLSFIVPDAFLRYLYFFLTLILGPLGVYFFSRNLIFKHADNKNEIASFGSGLFYLFNLAVVQQYYVPFEMFATHFASLPWLFLYAFKYIETKSTKSLLIFSLITFFSSSMAHTSTLWFVYFGALITTLFSYSLLKKNIQIFRASLILILATLLINSFWVLPNIYFILESGQRIGESKIHSLFSEEAFLQNKTFGTISDLLIFRNFLFNWGEYVGDNKFGPLLNEWSTHLDKPGVLLLGYLYSFIALVGILVAFFKKNKIAISIFLVFLVSIFFWLNVNPPLGFLFEFLQEKITFFREAFRFPFTKFSILLIFSFSIYFAFGLYFIIVFLEKLKGSRAFIKLGFFLLVLSFFYYMYPALEGNLISPSMKVKIPKEYFLMFEYFQNEPRGRVALLPIHNFWGWVYYDWGYQGAGFLWFGLPQPLLDREFDRWNPLNEQYYREMSNAIYAKDSDLLASVINKYDIKYFILDKSVIAAGSDTKSLFYAETLDLLENKLKFKKTGQFGDKLSVYKTNQALGSYAYLLNKPISVSPKAEAIYKDFAYSKYGDYITFGKELDNQVQIPLRNLIDNHDRVILPLKVSDGQLGLALKDNVNRNLEIPSLKTLGETFSFDLIANKNASRVSLSLYPRFPIKNSQVSSLPITSEIESKEDLILSINKNKFLTENLPQDTPLSLGKISMELNKDNFITVYEDKNEANINPDFSNITYFLNPCQDTKKPLYGINFTDKNSLSLFGEEVKLCFAIQLRQILPNLEVNPSEELANLLLNIDYNYKGIQPPYLCITPKNSLKCLSYFPKKIEKEQNSQKVSALHEIKISEIDNLELKIILDATSSPGKQIEAEYNAISLKIANPLYSIKIPKELIDASLSESYTIDKANTLVIPFSGDEKLSQDITKFPVTGGDCPPASPRGAPQNQKNIEKDTSGQFIRYSSKEGSYCDHFSYDSLSPNQSYLISVVSRNVKGLPMRMCVNNITTGRCDIFAHLTTSQPFKEEYFLIPPRGEGEEFDININNFSIKGTPSVNDLKSIHLIPFPYNLAYGIELYSGNPPGQSQRYYVENVSRINPSLYSVRLSQNSSSGVLVLSQSYDKGWKAYEANSLLAPIFPFFGKEISNHVLVNNWANGWVLGGDDKGEIVIVYWPQYLEYLGLLLSFTTLIFLTIKSYKSRRKI